MGAIGRKRGEMALTLRLAYLGMDKASASVLTPYLVWMSYATYLNAGFFWLNR